MSSTNAIVTVSSKLQAAGPMAKFYREQKFELIVIARQIACNADTRDRRCCCHRGNTEHPTI